MAGKVARIKEPIGERITRLYGQYWTWASIVPIGSKDAFRAEITYRGTFYEAVGPTRDKASEALWKLLVSLRVPSLPSPPTDEVEVHLNIDGFQALYGIKIWRAAIYTNYGDAWAVEGESPEDSPLMLVTLLLKRWKASWRINGSAPR